MLIQKSKTIIEKALSNFAWKDTNFEVWISPEHNKGHCYSNVVMVVASRFQQSTDQVYRLLVQFISQNSPDIENISLKNNFLNITFQSGVFNDVINRILQDEKCGYPVQNVKKINYEWVSANPTGFLHLGHARNVFVGQAIVNLLEFSGANVTKEFYINDSGNQVFQLGRTVFYHYQQLLGKKMDEFSQIYRNSELKLAAQAIIDQFGKKYEASNFLKEEKTQSFFIEFSKNFFLQFMQKNLTSWNIHFDYWFSEKSLLTESKLSAFLKILKDKKLSYVKDGALWMQIDEQDPSQDFVLIKKSGETTYFVGDIMYHIDKFERQYDEIIDIFGADHHYHYLKLNTVLKKLGYDHQRFSVDLLQMVKIVDGNQEVKMSKRSGTSIYLQELIEMVGPNFLKFMLMFRQKGTKFSFDLNLAKKRDASNPLFYTQYAYARSYQLLAKVQSQFKTFQNEQYQHLKTSFEQDLILQLHNFNSILEKATIKREPQMLVAYALKISKKFHVFYENTPVLKSEPTLQKERIHLVLAFSKVLKTVCQILGINLATQM